jgi:hypothetical protein
MKTNRNSVKLKLARCALMSAIALSLFALVMAQGRHGNRTVTEINENGRTDSEMRVRYDDGDHTLEIKAREPLEFTDDDADVRSIAGGGYLTIEERRGSMWRRFEVSPEAGGGLRRSFFQQGQPHAFDSDARAWLAEVLPDVIRNTAIGARARVQRIMRQHGAGGVLDEISLIKSDGAKRIYFRELLRSGNLDASLLHRAARQITHEISSDGEKAALLKESADLYLNNERIAPDFFEAVGSISSDGEHRLVLSAILKRNLSTANVIRALNSARAISSDGEKASLLVQYVEVLLQNPSSIPAFFETVNSIGSDGEHARVLSAVLRRHEPGKETLTLLLRSAERISSDGEKANVLVNAARVYGGDQSALSAITQSARTIGSDGERDRVLSAIAREGRHL